MRSALARQPGVITGLILLACWLGWTASSFAALGTRPAGDAAAVAQLLSTLQSSGVARSAGRPLALHFPDTDCTCADARPLWERTTQAMRSAGGDAIQAPATVSNPGGYELLVLDGDGQPVYAGPLSLPPLLCGQTTFALADWLPDLLSADTPPLFLPPRCSC
jgi:hypothetical protein